jgi:serine protease Do/serine protease DegQ
MKNVVYARHMRILALTCCALLTPALAANAAVPPALIEQQGPTLAPMLKKVMPAVVNIVATSEVQMARNPLMEDPFFRHFFDMPQQPQRRSNSSIGSGVIVDAAKGLILTNDHVVANADSITVRLSDDREIEAELIGSDPETDIAVLKIKASKLQSLPIGDSQNLQVGDFVVAVGNPFGLRQTVTSGIVSGLGRSGLGKRYEDFIQTDASINPGNSGGALIDLKGRLIGINTAILSRSGGNIGIGFAIPMQLASTVMAQILEHGEVQRGRLGVVGQDLDKDLAKAFGLERTRGVVVAQVVQIVVMLLVVT